MSKHSLYRITSDILQKIQRISRKLGMLEFSGIQQGEIRLRKENKIKTIQSSLAIEGNTLIEEQISSLLEGKRVLGPSRDIREVKNAIEV